MRATVTVIAMLNLLAVGYVLSYAPLYRYYHVGPEYVFYGGSIPAYRGSAAWESVFTPVQWLIDVSPLRAPLLWWADQFDVETDMWIDSWGRSN